MTFKTAPAGMTKFRNESIAYIANALENNPQSQPKELRAALRVQVASNTNIKNEYGISPMVAFNVINGMFIDRTCNGAVCIVKLNDAIRGEFKHKHEPVADNQTVNYAAMTKADIRVWALGTHEIIVSDTQTKAKMIEEIEAELSK